MVQVSKGCPNEVIIISLQEFIKRPLKGCKDIIFTCRQVIPYLDLYLKIESLLFNRFSCA